MNDDGVTLYMSHTNTSSGAKFYTSSGANEEAWWPTPLIRINPNVRPWPFGTMLRPRPGVQESADLGPLMVLVDDGDDVTVVGLKHGIVAALDPFYLEPVP